jgi:hypothetical protein
VPKVLWDYYLHLDNLLASRLSYFMLAQSFLVIAAVTGTASTGSSVRIHVVTMTIEVVGLVLTGAMWYVFTDSVRYIRSLSLEARRHSSLFEDLGKLHIDDRKTRWVYRALMKHAPNQVLTTDLSVLLAAMWVVLIVVSIVVR